MPPDEPRRIIYVLISRLRFDPQGPRLPRDLRDATEDALLEWMLDDTTLTELMGSIAEQGYFEGEPVLAVESGDEGEYVVIEGNRRLAATKLLADPERAPIRKRTVARIAAEANYRPDSIPVVVFETRDEIVDYLGYRHVTGIKPWDPLAKARYLEELFERSKIEDREKQIGDLARTIGSRSDYVARLLTALNAFDEIAEADFFDIKGLNERTLDFSLLATAFNYKNLVDYLGLESATSIDLAGLNQSHLEDMTRWMFEKKDDGRTVLGESRNIRQLAAVVDSKPALDVLGSGKPLSEAVLFTEVPSQIFRNSLQEAWNRLNLAQSHIHLVDDPQPSDFSTLDELRRMVRTMLSALEASREDEHEAGPGQ